MSAPYIRHWDGSAWQQSWAGKPKQLIHSISDIGWAIGTSGDYRYHESRVLALRRGAGSWSDVPGLEVLGELPALDGAFVQPWEMGVTGTSGADVWVAGRWHREDYKLNPFVAQWVDGTGGLVSDVGGAPRRWTRMDTASRVPRSRDALRYKWGCVWEPPSA